MYSVAFTKGIWFILSPVQDEQVKKIVKFSFD
jgi:hypothetical protein